LAVDLERRAAQAQADLERRADGEVDVRARAVERRADAEAQRNEHRAALGDHRRDQVGQVPVARVAVNVGEAEQDVEPGAAAETDLHVEPGGVTEEQAEAEVGARRRGPRGEDPEDDGHGQELLHPRGLCPRVPPGKVDSIPHLPIVACWAGTQVAPGFAYGGTWRDS